MKSKRKEIYEVDHNFDIDSNGFIYHWLYLRILREITWGHKIIVLIILDEVHERYNL